MSKDKNILSKHPEAANNGRGYFNFETNRIPQEVVQQHVAKTTENSMERSPLIPV
jgi:hypothetical protein